ncbi:hypothetical protein BC361_30120 [Ensifer sp. LC54]|nr:hypothetical protein BC361_30120 [Ensifer sp. LC54]OCP25952.1 hypothetical protein BC363_19530 [Ensifer sp. LC384]
MAQHFFNFLDRPLAELGHSNIIADVFTEVAMKDQNGLEFVTEEKKQSIDTRNLKNRRLTFDKMAHAAKHCGFLAVEKAEHFRVGGALLSHLGYDALVSRRRRYFKFKAMADIRPEEFLVKFLVRFTFHINDDLVDIAVVELLKV